MFRRAIAIAVAVVAGASVAQAEILDIHWEIADGDPAVSNSVQNTLFTTATVDWNTSAINVQLDSGSLLNPVDTSPNEFRTLGGDNDTWLAVPSATDGGFPSIQLFQENDPQFPLVGPDEPDTSFIWFDTADTGSFTDGIHARIYASDDANGTYLVRVFDDESGDVGTALSGFVVNGEFRAIPEPASIALLGFAVAGLMMSRRRKRETS